LSSETDYRILSVIEQNPGSGSRGTRVSDERLDDLLDESRASYRVQIETIESIDDKAMRTVRTTVLILGFIVSAVGIGGPTAVGDLSTPTMLVSLVGVGCLLGAGVYGVGTYTVTSYEPGVGPKDRARAVRLESAETQRYLLEMYDRWARDISSEIEQNTTYLETAQWSLLVGSALLLYASLLFIGRTAFNSDPVILVVVTVLLVVLAVLVQKHGE